MSNDHDFDQKQERIMFDLASAIDEENDKVEFRLTNDIIQIDWIQFNKYSQIVRCKSQNKYTIEYLSGNLYKVQQEHNIKEESIRNFFKLIQEEKGEISNDQYCDLCKLAEIFQVNSLKKLLKNYLNKCSQNVDFIINLMIEHQSFEKCDFFGIDYFKKEMEICLIDNIDRCLSNKNFGKLNIASIYRIIEKSNRQKITSDLLYDFISQSIQDRFSLLNFLDVKTLSDKKFNDLCNTFIDFDSNIKFLDYLPNNISYIKALKDSNKDLKNEIDNLKNKNELIENKIIEKTNEFETRIDQLKKENDEIQLKINKVKHQNDILIEENNKIKNDSETRINQLEKEKIKLNEMIEQLKQEDNKNKLIIEQLNEKNKLLENENSKKIKELKTKITQLDKEKVELNKICENLNQEMKNIQKVVADRINIFINLYANLDQLDLDENQIDMIKTFILYDRNLSENENELLLFAYKSLVKNKRNLLLMIEQYLKNDFCDPEILQKLKEVISTQIKKCCIEMINIVDKILIHREKDIESQIFYEKHKADYYRYICESDPDEKTINKSQQCYDKAFEIAKDKISSSSSLYLGLILNYSVFLYDIKKQTQKAIEISQKACNEAKDINDSDASGIISLILENIQLWTDEC